MEAARRSRARGRCAPGIRAGGCARRCSRARACTHACSRWPHSAETCSRWIAPSIHRASISGRDRSQSMAASMRSARLHEPGQPLRIDTVEIPEPRPRDVLVRVKACGIIPNMNAIFSGRLWNHLPPLPASVGLDAAGVIAKVGSEVTDVAVGDRVYVNPCLSCGTCPYCRAGEPMLCSAAAFQGYFGFFPHSTRQLLDYPFGGFSEYITASPQRLVHLPSQVTFEQAARFGYLGTSFAALRCAQVGGGSWIAINGITGTLGVGATLLALGLGATRILGFGRNRDVLAQLKALAPDRIEVLVLGDAPIADWMRQHTDQ